MRIIRHNLDITDYQTVTLPHDGDLLSVAQSRTDRNQLIAYRPWILPSR